MEFEIRHMTSCCASQSGLVDLADPLRALLPGHSFNTSFLSAFANFDQHRPSMLSHDCVNVLC